MKNSTLKAADMPDLRIQLSAFEEASGQGISGRELARRCGCNERLVRRLADRGVFDAAMVGGRFDAARAEPLMRAHLDRNRHRRPASARAAGIDKLAQARSTAYFLLETLLDYADHREDLETM